MAKTVPVIAQQPLEWGGRSYPAGATVVLPVIDALTLKRKRLVSLTRKAAPPEPVAPPPPPPPEPPTRRKYKRRDLQAEDTSPSVAEPIVVPVPVVETPTPDPEPES